jgi:rare lipoprotein A
MICISEDSFPQQMKTGQIKILKCIAGLTMIVCVTGCGIFSKTPPSAMEPTGASAGAGGFYKDDGPGLFAPSNLEEIPDAIPKMEPLLAGPMRPYVVLGKGYSPMTRLEPYKERGIATWYGRRYHGKPTSSGETYDMYAMTAAHTVLPIPSYVRVTNIANKKSVVVRVNDRGPFIGNRLIDLSYTAAYKLGLATAGSGMVEVELIIPGNEGPPKAPAPAPAAGTAPAPVSSSSSPGSKPQTGGFFVQLAAFNSRENADAYLQQLRAQKEFQGEPLQIRENAGLFRVHAGPYPNETAAKQSADRVARLLNIKPLVSAN